VTRQADQDIDGDLREPARDIGAGERSDVIFADGFSG